MSAEPREPGQDPRLREGLRRFEAGAYYEAHDTLEELWFDEVGAAKRGVQALIQLAVALYHRGNGNLRGARRLFTTAADIFEELESGVLGLDVVDLGDRCRRLAAEVEPQIGATTPVFDPALVPSFRDRP